MWHVFKKHDRKVASSMKLKTKDISRSGWEVRREQTV